MKMDSSVYWRRQISFMIGFFAVGIMAMCIIVIALDFSNITTRLVMMYLPIVGVLLIYPSSCIAFCQISKIWIENGCIYSKPVLVYHRDFVGITRALIIYALGSLLLEILVSFGGRFVLYIMGLFDSCIAVYIIVCLIKAIIRIRKSRYITDDDVNDLDLKTVYSDRYIYFQIVSGNEGMYSGVKKHLVISNEPFEHYPNPEYRTLGFIERCVNNTRSQLYVPYDKSILQIIKTANGNAQLK